MNESPSSQEEELPSNVETEHVSFPVIVIGTSMGGLEALKVLIADLPSDLEAAILIVWHMPAEATGILPFVLNKLGTLPVFNATDGEIIQKGTIYVAPVDHHLLVESNKLRITRGPKENRFRPAVDPLFRSAAREYQSHAIGIILTGALDDGTSGLWQIKNFGGIAIVQEPRDAEVKGMPESAIRHVAVDYVMPLREIARLLTGLVKELAMQPILVNMQKDERTEIELRVAKEESKASGDVFKLGDLSPFTCPECHGVLTAIAEGNLKRYRCHTGHAFSPGTLLSALTENIEDSLWSAIRSIRESTMLMNHIGDHFAEHNDAKLAALYFRKAQEADERVWLLREVVMRHEQLSSDTVENDALHIDPAK